MRILWIVNLLLPQLSNELGVKNSASGTWLFEWSKKINDSSNDFAIACVFGTKFKSLKIDKTTFYLLPGTGKNMIFYTKKYEKYWKKIVSDFKPDFINIHGTEYCHGLSCMRANPNEKYIISMQGILSKIQYFDYGGLTKTQILFNRTLKECFKFNGIIENHITHKNGAKYEIEMIKRAKFIACVNDYDDSFVRFINPKAKIFKVDYDMQSVFKNSKKWSIQNCTKHSIFTNPGGTPLKGIHQLFKAVFLLKEKYPNINVVVPGMGKKGELIIKNGYSKIIKKLIKQLGIQKNITFLGYQTPKQMCENMLKSNLVVVPSAIEGTSLILRESMYLGCPTIASFRGGMANYIVHGVDGYSYDFYEHQYLAMLIDKAFCLDDKNIMGLSAKAILKTQYYDSNQSFNSLMEMYRFVFNDK